MPSKGKAVGSIVKWGVKYGPHVVVIAQQAKDPAMAAAQKAIDKQKQRRRALEHAGTLREGSVLKTFDPRGDQSEPIWVVFTGDDAIASHPSTQTPLAEVLANADLANRVRPQDIPSPAERLRQLPHRARRR